MYAQVGIIRKRNEKKHTQTHTYTERQQRQQQEKQKQFYLLFAECIVQLSDLVDYRNLVEAAMGVV